MEKPTESKTPEQKEPHQIRLGCGHFITMYLTKLETARLGEEMEQDNPTGKTTYCEQCKSHSVLTCVYN